MTNWDFSLHSLWTSPFGKSEGQIKVRTGKQLLVNSNSVRYVT